MSVGLRKCQLLEEGEQLELACGALPALGLAWVPRPRILESAKGEEVGGRKSHHGRVPLAEKRHPPGQTRM